MRYKIKDGWIHDADPLVPQMRIGHENSGTSYGNQQSQGLYTHQIFAED